MARVIVLYCHSNFLNMAIMTAQKGNTLSMKYKTQAERQGLCDRYCAHISEGYSKESFVECDHKTVERYARDFPGDFPAEKLQAAFSASRLFWEKAGLDGMFGKIEGFNAPTWIFNMKNRHGWRDQKEVQTTLQGPDGGPIQIVSSKQLERMAKEFLVSHGSESASDELGEE